MSNEGQLEQKVKLNDKVLALKKSLSFDLFVKLFLNQLNLS